MHLSPRQFAVGNTLLTLVWLGIAIRIVSPTRRATARPSFRPVVAGACAAIFLVLLATPARAQIADTRQGLQAAERAEKAGALKTYEPTRLERRLQKIDQMLSSDRPFHLAMGSSFEGAGLAFGPGYRTRFGDTGKVEARTTWSFRNYKTADAKVSLPSFANDRITLDVHGNWTDAPRVPFFGLGTDTSRDHRSDFAYRSTSAGVSGNVKLSTALSFGASLDAIQTEGTAVANVSPAIDPSFRRTGIDVQYDTRTSPDYTRRGTLARIAWSDYNQAGGSVHDFRRVDAEVQQFVPLMRENWVLAFRAMASTTDAGEGASVPYFLMPALGGQTLLRGFSNWRFRDQNRMLLSGEYRWMAGQAIDMAVFVDAGKVAASRSDLNFANLQVSHGVGIRIHTPNATVARFEVARSREGTSLILSFGPSF